MKTRILNSRAPFQDFQRMRSFKNKLPKSKKRHSYPKYQKRIQRLLLFLSPRQNQPSCHKDDQQTAAEHHSSQATSIGVVCSSLPALLSSSQSQNNCAVVSIDNAEDTIPTRKWQVATQPTPRKRCDRGWLWLRNAETKVRGATSFLSTG